MTKRDLIGEVARLYPRYALREVESIVNAVFEGLTAALARGEGIEVRGFGSFRVQHYPARAGRNPKTGAVVAVAAKTKPRFKAGKELRARVAGQEDIRRGRRMAKPLTERVAGQEG
jgi:integration host factor subunit beta